MISPELFFSRRRRRGIIRDPEGLFPRRLLCLDEVGAQTCKSFSFSSSTADYQVNIYLHLSPLRRDASPLSTRSFFSRLTVTSPALQSRVMERVSLTFSLISTHLKFFFSFLIFQVAFLPPIAVSLLLVLCEVALCMPRQSLLHLLLILGSK